MFFLPTPERMDSGDNNVLPGSSVADYVVGDDEMPDGASKTSTAPTALKAPQGGGDGRITMHEDSKEQSSSNKAEARVNEAAISGKRGPLIT